MLQPVSVKNIAQDDKTGLLTSIFKNFFFFFNLKTSGIKQLYYNAKRPWSTWMYLVTEVILKAFKRATPIMNN